MIIEFITIIIEFMRYGHEISLPERCDRCNELMDLNHEMNCKKSGRSGEVRT